MSLKVIKSRCPQNHRCPATSVCPVDALAQDGFSAPSIDNNICVSCGKCVRFCPTGALQLD